MRMSITLCYHPSENMCGCLHDEMEVDDLTGNRPINHFSNQEEESFHGANYRYEPENRREQLVAEGVVCPNCEGEEVHHDSWVFGDPSTPILRGYVGDPAKIRLFHGGVKGNACIPLSCSSVVQ